MTLHGKNWLLPWWKANRSSSKAVNIACMTTMDKGWADAAVAADGDPE
jgi:hypothetical protein